ncbi:MAG: UDP-N-acetylmuramoyl-L-alanyl-D-glutamate--2,6-diaminopimelate ligase [Planctomycetaceae bacterium]|nr:UDP-N-acetylmuramoyl-L-alanyl-D-glutamate--2,6-diaminopimelate ligase [Planctomycetaceae bacterium]
MASFVGCADIHVTHATENSADCQPGSLFAAIAGTQTDGIEFVGEALQHGATGLLVARPLAGVSVPQCIVGDIRSAYSTLCHALYGHPSCRLKVCGVTGTNGKTTVTWLLRSILTVASKRAGLLGTIEYFDGVSKRDASLTTPDSRTLSQWLQSMVRRGCSHAAMELSSHALDQGRATGIRLDAAIVTNVTQDHFDYHGDFETYQKAKANIFQQCRPGGFVAINADDAGSAALHGSVPEGLSLRTFGIDGDADVRASIVDQSRLGTRFLVELNGESIDFETPLVGKHNVSNCLAAISVASHWGLATDAIVDGIAALNAVPGRLERIDCGQSFDVFVDYAHTDDALKRCVSHLRQLATGRVICVFGAGGDRDKLKRPMLGKAAADADVVVVTSDNPRSEEPNKIIRDILIGFDASKAGPHVEADRSAAIRWAIDQAEPNDCVLIAGKGHETVQIIGDERHPFDDRQVARDALNDRVTLEQRRIGA